MNFSAFFMLLCSASLTYARVLSRGADASSSGIASIGCDDPDGLISRSDNAPLANSTAVSKVKTVIPDLTSAAYQYRWYDLDGFSYLEWNGIDIDVLSVPESATNILTVEQALNKILDKNPNKVPLRDILLSYWQYRRNRQVQDLETIVYEDVIEENLKAMLPEIYDLLGRDIHDDMKNKASFQLSPRGTGDEQVAYFKLLNGCPFPAGAKKMLAEYSEFDNRALGNFEFEWTGGNHFNFKVHFFK